MKKIKASQITRLLNRRRAAIQNRNPEFKPKAIDSQEKDGVLTLYAYGVVGEDWWGDGVSALEVAKLVDGFSGEKIVVRLNSPGGDVFEGVAIFNSLLAHEAEIEIRVDGLAASAASLIAMAGDRVVMGSSSRLMVHRAWTFAMGNEEDLDYVANLLRGIDSDLVDVYTERTGLPRSEVVELVNAETWLTADEAIEKGFADGRLDSAAAKNQTERTDFSAFERLRIAAWSPKKEGIPMSKEKKPEAAEVTPDVQPEKQPEQPAAAAVEPAAATFAELLELAGDDTQFIVAQLKAGASIDDATKAWTGRLADAKAAAEADAAESRRKLEALQAGLAGSEATPVSASDDVDPDDPKAERRDRLTTNLGDRMGRYAASLKLAERN